MLIYGDNKKECRTPDLLDELQSVLSKAESSSFSSHTHIVELLIRYGEFESALTDLLCLEEDTVSPLIFKLRKASLLTGSIFLNSLEGDRQPSFSYSNQLRAILSGINCYHLPGLLTVNVPEGYAYYGLYPEMYVEAARQFFKKRKPDNVVTLGIRSIGTSLSSVVSAALKANGCRVESFTLRPRGEYFNRQVKISEQLRDELASKGHTYFLIVDEGPGLSGTSLCSTAGYISSLGVDDDKIIFFPSWVPDANSFVTEDSKQRWIRHEKYTVGFEEAFLTNKKLAGSLPYENLFDISAGAWRSLFYNDSSEYPPVFQNFEQRKYLCTKFPLQSNEEAIKTSNDNNGGNKAEEIFFIKFSGLGEYGQSLYERAVDLHKAGYSPKAVGLSNGFIVYEFVNGKPLTVSDADKTLLEKIASYIAFIYSNYPAPPGRTQDEMKEMIRINLSKGLGESFAQIFLASGLSGFIPGAKAWAVDGRMLPHEWLRTNHGFIKTDSVHHHSDHFFPGCTDIAWDLAGSIVEFNLDYVSKEYFIDKYISFSEDKDVRRRLPFYLLAYLAFRLGYTRFASGRLGESQDKSKFILMAEQYSSLIKHQLANTA